MSRAAPLEDLHRTTPVERPQPPTLRQAMVKALSRLGPEVCGAARLATPADFPTIDRLNRSVLDECGGPSVLMRQGVDFFEKVHAAGGAIALVSDDGRAFAYSVAVPATHGFTPFRWAGGRIGLVFGTAIRRDYSGRGWQRRLIRARVEALFASGFGRHQAIVSPSNHRSLRNLVHCGFNVVGQDSHRYATPRFVVEHTPNIGKAGSVGTMGAPLPLPPEGDWARHKACLAIGARGVRVEREGVWHMRYALDRGSMFG